VVVADPAQAVLSPAIRTSAGMVVGEIVPRGPVPGVVLPDGSPLALAQVGTPPPPVDKCDRLASRFSSSVTWGSPDGRVERIAPSGEFSVMWIEAFNGTSVPILSEMAFRCKC